MQGASVHAPGMILGNESAVVRLNQLELEPQQITDKLEVANPHVKSLPATMASKDSFFG